MKILYTTELDALKKVIHNIFMVNRNFISYFILKFVKNIADEKRKII